MAANEVSEAQASARKSPAVEVASALAASDHRDPFDFVAHRQAAVDGYQAVRDRYEEFASTVQSILKARLAADAIKVNSVEYRAKTIESFADKAERPNEDDPSRPKYLAPLDEIKDLAGIRVITQFLATEARVDELIAHEFEIVEKTDRSAVLYQEERLGYHSVHYLVRLRTSRKKLPEYAQFAGMVAEIQVRTVLQHAWAEIEHDIQYKARTALPAEIRRRFMTLAGLLEIADREFQGIEDASNRLQAAARESLAAGRLEDVEVTPESLKTYADAKLGPDKRLNDFSYQLMAQHLVHVGFRNMRELDTAIGSYDQDAVSKAIYGSRQGQLTRLEMVLAAAMGAEYGQRHPWNKNTNGWYARMVDDWITKLRAANIPIGSYVPPQT